MMSWFVAPLFLLIGAVAGLWVTMSVAPRQPMQISHRVELPDMRSDETVRAQSPWNRDYFTNTPVVTHEGRTLRFYDDLIKDKIVVINFLYTSCAETCSLTTARLAEVRALLGDRVGRDIFFYSITLDPVVDGPEVLHKYASHFYDGPGWLFLTGTPENIDLIRHRLGERSRARELHRNDIMLGNDLTGEWGRNSIFTDVAELAWHIERMDPGSRGAAFVAAEGRGSAGSLIALPNTPGEALFAKVCAGCHTIGDGRKIGPDLADVSQRREHDWLVRFIVAPNAMFAEEDPTAMALLDEYGGLKMPNLSLNDTDARDLLSYITRMSDARRRDAPRVYGTAAGPPDPHH